MAMVPVVQREWVAKHPRATFKTPITVEDVLNSRMIAYQPALPKSALVVLSGYGTLHAKKESAKRLRSGWTRGRGWRSTCGHNKDRRLGSAIRWPMGDLLSV
jgi:acetyl-CoA acetyltransferase